MDAIDKKILECLKNNARMQVSCISKVVNLSIPAVSERIRKLEESGIIEKFTLSLNRELMNYGLLAFLFVNIERTEHIDEFRKSIAEFNIVLECHHLAGEYDYLLKVVSKDTKDLEDFISNRLKKIRGVQRTNTIIVLSSVKEEINA
ncbi:putative HTH-type transcriptional regulator (plasmid) [Peptoclostridium acidaminophilum DSM 3953]|uniref:Putative HTH-type transcriptional regulator n=1 Tax=Peptoclostridium acidaminophilum DSM 3953 TaxID=1286171 RepID=W8UC24_PEPAC|nr:Lrp/AsnC family transcriptional regulator [Peptoclostridium acidaminophilum]AHM58271.1 putative HTH-type transcriptional regulator [Peptoclostridium acidaminophilum DSM 3953]